jgi:hypothetical protein
MILCDIIYDMICYDIYGMIYDMVWYDMMTCYNIIYDMIIFNCKWVDTRWQQYSTYLHTNSTQNTENGT